MVTFLVIWIGFEKWIEGNRREQEERERGQGDFAKSYEICDYISFKKERLRLRR